MARQLPPLSAFQTFAKEKAIAQCDRFLPYLADKICL
jgi:hypothetical protein